MTLGPGLHCPYFDSEAKCRHDKACSHGATPIRERTGSAADIEAVVCRLHIPVCLRSPHELWPRRERQLVDLGNLAGVPVLGPRLVDLQRSVARTMRETQKSGLSAVGTSASLL